LKSLVKEAGLVSDLIELDKFLREEVDLTIDLVHGPRMVFIDVVVWVVTYILKVRPGLPWIGLRIRIRGTVRLVRIARLGRIGRRGWCRRGRRSWRSRWDRVRIGIIGTLWAISLTITKLITNTSLVVITCCYRVLCHPVYWHTSIISKPN